MKIAYRFLVSILLVVCLMAPSTRVYAGNIDGKEARKVAAYFMAAQFGSKAITPSSLQLVYEIPNVTSGIPTLYAFNTADKRGFVIVSGTECLDPIIAYSTDGIFDPDNIPPAMQWWLDGQANMIAYAQNNNLEAGDAVIESWKTLQEQRLPYFGRNSKDRTILLKTQWNQNYPFNILCPEVTNGSWNDIHGRAYVGCVATAMSQILRYWEYPRVGADTAGYDLTDRSAGLDTHLFVNYAEAYYDYDNMPEKVTPATPEQQIYEIAKLGYHCGVSVSMGYNGDGSGAQSSKVTGAFKKNFKYDPDSIKFLIRSSPSYYNTNAATSPNARDTAWVDRIVSDLVKGRPVYYGGYSPSGGRDAGHAFVCDGVDTYTKKLHFNWGWGGSGDSWCNVYTMQLKPSSAPQQDAVYNFTDDHKIIVGLTPPKDSIRTNTESVLDVDNPFIAAIYPNPASSQITVSYMLNDNNASMLQIFDAAGRMVNQIEVSPAGNHITIPVSDLHPGIYFCRINGYTQKFVVR